MFPYIQEFHHFPIPLIGREVLEISYEDIEKGIGRIL